MDLLFQRYADPMTMLDIMIGAGGFSRFVGEFMKNVNETQQWDYFLHKVFDKSFNEFKESLNNTEPVEHPSDEAIGATITESQSITLGFIPDAEGEI